MSDKTPETPLEPAADEAAAVPESAVPVVHDEAVAAPSEVVEPVSGEPVETGEPVELVEPEVDAAEPTADGTEALAETAQPEVAAEATTEATTEVVAEPQPAPAAPLQTVYVHAPVPPSKKGNRGIGSLIALGSAVIFAAIYAGVVLVVVPLFAPPRAVGFEFLHFIASTAFFIPVLVFAVAFILLVLILNRAGWWAHVLGSLFVGLVVYFASIGILLLLNGIIGSTLSEGLGAFRSALQSPVTIIAGLVGREVALWMGAAIAARGRKVRARNVDARAAYDRDTARARADYERAVAANAAH